MPRKSSACKLAPPTSAPSTSAAPRSARGFVGDDEALGSRPVRHGRFELPADNFERALRLALGARLSDAHDRAQSGPPRGLRLGTNNRVGFVMMGAALGMPGDDGLDAAI